MYSLHIVTFTILSNHERVNENAVAAATVFFSKEEYQSIRFGFAERSIKIKSLFFIFFLFFTVPFDSNSCGCVCQARFFLHSLNFPFIVQGNNLTDYCLFNLAQIQRF